MEWVGDRASVADRDGRSHAAAHKRDEQLSVREPEPEQTIEGTKRLGREIRSLVKRPRVSEALPIA